MSKREKVAMLEEFNREAIRLGLQYRKDGDKVSHARIQALRTRILKSMINHG